MTVDCHQQISRLLASDSRLSPASSLFIYLFIYLFIVCVNNVRLRNFRNKNSKEVLVCFSSFFLVFFSFFFLFFFFFFFFFFFVFFFFSFLIFRHSDWDGRWSSECENPILIFEQMPNIKFRHSNRVQIYQVSNVEMLFCFVSFFVFRFSFFAFRFSFFEI